MKRFYMIIGLVAVIGIGAVGYSMTSGASAASEPIEIGELTDAELVGMAEGVVFGDPDAPITVLEFGDYQCPACAHFGLQVKPQLDLTYVETGQVKLVFHEFPLIGIHPHAFLAARGARCAGEQDQYWPYHDTLFRNQTEWSGLSNPFGRFVSYADATGLDRDEFEACLKSDRHADVISANLQLGTRLGVTGTPTVMVSQGGMANRLADFRWPGVQEGIEKALGN